MKCIGGTFSGRKAKIDTTWSVPKCIPGCSVSCITVVTVIQWYFPSLMGETDPLLFIENKSSLRQESFTQGCHHDLLCSVERMTPGVELVTQLFIKY